jgi:hypothetical protein
MGRTKTRAAAKDRKGHERWYDILDYENRYQVSTQGRVRSMARIDDGGLRRSLRLLKHIVATNGRRYVSLCKRGISKYFSVSVLLARAYGIPNPRQCDYAIHLNGDHQDFTRRNLAWATLAELRMNTGHKWTTRYYGVRCDGRSRGVLRWIAAVSVNGRRHELGNFATPEAAAYEYDRTVKLWQLRRPLNDVTKPKAYEPEIESLPGEIWRPFPGSERTHMISNRGRVRTLAHRTRRGQRVLAKLRKVTVGIRGYRSLVIKGRRYGILKSMAQAGFSAPDTRSSSSKPQSRKAARQITGATSADR